MKEEQVFRCEYGTVVTRGTINQTLLAEGCRRAVLMDMRARRSKKRKDDEDAA